SQEYSSNRAGRYEESSNRGGFSDFGSKNWENDENDMSNNISMYEMQEDHKEDVVGIGAAETVQIQVHK
ncbi:unnamed protein product, partial [Didymodactylos carnosus]